ncbi:Gluconate utilization system GNT-I transcriptional repressor [Serratia rubidaea]|uniref:Gluconate utilization system GNT-I transcriptional repressor n=1 Tax=Serratia rubidaea TaxID=61652 RepID=A0A447QLD0_SERRU|nr:Gluconate utilization system GNT-I transcriptional repressor [Serratia rubidaea]
MREAGLQPRSIMTNRASSYSGGGEMLRQAQRDYPQIDSVFCTNDDLAIGAAFECQRQGLSIPQDMAIAGFHGHDIGQVMMPKLASVLTPRETMGQIGAERLLARLRAKPSARRWSTLVLPLSPAAAFKPYAAFHLPIRFLFFSLFRLCSNADYNSLLVEI